MKITRDVQVEAEDKGLGMTVEELRACLRHVPCGVVPRVEISLMGKIKAIKFQVKVETES